MKQLIITISLILISIIGFGQTYNMSNTSISTCSGTYYDAGGSGANYNNSESFTQTFTPSTAGNMLQFVFTAFSTESITYDYLIIYDGPNTSSPIIGTYGGSTSPGTITANNPTGQLTFVWVSDSSYPYAGWSATISCVPPPTAYNMTNGTINTCSGNFYDPQGTANYIDNNGTITETFCSGTAQAISFNFSTFQTNEVADNLTIYNGPNTGSPLIGTYSLSSGPGVVVSSGTCLRLCLV